VGNLPVNKAGALRIEAKQPVTACCCNDCALWRTATESDKSVMRAERIEMGFGVCPGGKCALLSGMVAAV
jgi:hypothetical protein